MDMEAEAAREENSASNPKPDFMVEDEQLENKDIKGTIFIDFFRKIPPPITSADFFQQIPPPPATSREDSRILKLERILKTLRELDSSSPMLFNLSPLLFPTVDEQRIYQLLFFHLSYCIFLYHRESFCSHIQRQQQPPVLTTIPFPSISIDDDNENQEYLQDLNAVSREFPMQLTIIIELLNECHSSTTVPPCKNSIFFHPSREPPKHRRLLDVLLDLEELAGEREFAPPNHGREIESYKEIQQLVTFFLTRMYAYVEYAQSVYPHDRYPRDTPFWRNIIRRCCVENNLSICSPVGHNIAEAFDLIPTTLSLLERYKRQLSSIFSKEGDGSGGYAGESDSDRVDDRIGRTELNPRAIVKSKIDCLRIIVAKFMRVRELPSDSYLTVKEVRLYAQIAMHLKSAFWLWNNEVMEVETNTGSGCHEVNVASVEDLFCSSLTVPNSKGSGCHEVNVASVEDLFCSSSTVPNSKGDNTSIRERYLLEIVSYLRAIRSSCALAIPTSEELQYYKILSTMLHDYMCSFSFPRENAVGGTDEIMPSVISGEVKSVLRHQLDSFDRIRLKFLVKLNELCASIINMIRGLVMPNEKIEDLSYEATKIWQCDLSNTKRLGVGLKEFFRELPEGRIDQAILNMEEVSSVMSDISFLLDDATEFTSSRLEHLDYEIVAAEVHHALLITGNIKHLIFETV